MNREEWDALQVRKMRSAIKALEKLNALHDERRLKDSEREPPPGWIPEQGTVFGSEATPELRRALGDGE